MPVSKLSYSTLTLLLRNAIIFKMQEILGIYDRKSSVSSAIGKAGHEALKAYYLDIKENPGSRDPAERRGWATDAGLLFLNMLEDEWIDYGKEGTREKMLSGYARAMEFYWAEEPKYHKILLCEEKLEAEIRTVDGDLLPLPAVGIPDLLHGREDNVPEIIDVKFVKNFTDYEKEDFLKIIQAEFLFHLIIAAKGITPERCVFREVKWTLNSGDNAGKPQIRDWVVQFDHDQYRVFFYNIYNDAVNFLRGNPLENEAIMAVLREAGVTDPSVVLRAAELLRAEMQRKGPVFLPNIGDPMDGEQAGLIYAQGLISGDMSDVEVMHKVKDVAFVSKKFVPSRLDSPINKHLLPEEKVTLRLAEFGIAVEPEGSTVGASVTQYRFKVSRGVRMATVKKHKDDIARALEAKGEVRIIAPIPGTSLIGIEIENEKREIVKLSPKHLKPGTLSVPIGIDVHGESVCIPLSEMPHLLVAGSTGSGKSVFLHNVITALTKQMVPDDLHLVLIDPKRVELVAFAKSKHLRGGKIIYRYDNAMTMLRGIDREMENRYELLEAASKRDIGEYNEIAKKKMSYIVIVIDEFADLILQGKSAEKRNKRMRSAENAVRRVEVEKMARQFAKLGIHYRPSIEDEDDREAEELIARIAAMARATGIHLVIATQRPSVDIITGVIKANFPTRIALTTSSPTDSVVILGVPGAEKLAGKGDMLLMSPAVKGLQRLQGFALK